MNLIQKKNSYGSKTLKDFNKLGNKKIDEEVRSIIS